MYCTSHRVGSIDREWAKCLHFELIETLDFWWGIRLSIAAHPMAIALLLCIVLLRSDSDLLLLLGCSLGARFGSSHNSTLHFTDAVRKD